jgi:DNA-binding transcriptional LysR family regulator
VDVPHLFSEYREGRLKIIDFYHLSVFESLLKLKSVSLAAESLDIPQPTLSRYLAQLRKHFGDPLFVRTHDGMEPTTVAQSLRGPIADSLAIFRNRLSGSSEFDPATSTRNFHIAASDIGHLLVLPGLIQACGTIAPHVRFTATPIGKAKLNAQLETGKIDLAIGSFPNLVAGARVQTLFREEYVCVHYGASDDEGPALTLDKFKSAQHIVVAAHLLGHVHKQVERRVVSLCKAKNIRIVTESFLLSALLAERTNLVLTVPSRVAQVLLRAPQRVFKPPVKLPGFDVKQYWHDRFDKDPGNRWLRHTLAGIWRSAPISKPPA